MKCSRVIFALSLTGALFSGCSTSSSDKSAGNNAGKFYAVSAKETPFYHYGPQQGNGPDQKLPQDTIIALVRPSFGYCKVRLLNGEQGYVASEDIHVASPALVAAATAPPPVAATNSVPKLHLDPNDPRLIAPPPPLPIDLPEPTPLPGTEDSPVP